MHMVILLQHNEPILAIHSFRLFQSIAWSAVRSNIAQIELLLL